jgi:hypothetical protein
MTNTIKNDMSGLNMRESKKYQNPDRPLFAAYHPTINEKISHPVISSMLPPLI